MPLVVCTLHSLDAVHKSYLQYYIYHAYQYVVYSTICEFLFVCLNHINVPV